MTLTHGKPHKLSFPEKLIPQKCRIQVTLFLHIHWSWWGPIDIIDHESCWFSFISLIKQQLGGGFKHFFFHPYLGKISNLTNIFQMGGKKPPTRQAVSQSFRHSQVPDPLTG